MRLTNTSHYDTDEARELIEFAMRGVNTAHVAVHLKNSSQAYGGMNYDGIPSVAKTHETARSLITLRIGAPDKFPATVQYPGLKTAPRYVMETWQEALVAVAAHEAHHHRVHHINHRRHAARNREVRNGNVPQALVKEMRNSEVSAERHAVKKLELYRELRKSPGFFPARSVY
jgi:hypothetical protein